MEIVLGIPRTPGPWARVHLNAMRARILIIEDDLRARALLEEFLVRNGLSVTTLGTGEQVAEVVLRQDVSLVLLDLMLPGEDGLSICKRLRASGAKVPIIMLTAKAEALDRIIGLEIGADDYVVKPFEPRELVARINAVLRRTNMLPPRRSGENPKKVGFESWVFDLDKRELQGADSVSIPLSTAEFRLLEVLVHRPNVVLTRDQLLDLTASRSPQLFDRSIDNQVSRLRRKIEIDPRRPNLIKTVRGDGYVFAADVRTLEP